MGYYRSTLKKGSNGVDTALWQETLKNAGYDVDINGNFDDKTFSATQSFQTDKMLTADGNVNDDTWKAAGFTLAPSIAGFSSDATAKKNDIYKQYNDREFSYDINSDVLYKQLKDQYINQGEIAMEDIMGRAAAMTGGYGNSYAATVGAQAYQEQLDKLNDEVPYLYELALDKYNDEGDKLLTQYSMLQTQEESDYTKYRDLLTQEEKELAAFADRYEKYQEETPLSDAPIDDKPIDGQNFTLDDIKVNIGEAIAKGTTFEDVFGYINDNVVNNTITSKEKQLAIQYFLDEIGTEGYYVVSNGASNLGGIDKDAKITIPGSKEPMTLKDFIDYLEDLGMNRSDAKRYVKKLQEELGISRSGDTETKYREGTLSEAMASPERWQVTSKGGSNFLGIDRDAKVLAPDGKEYTLSELRDKLKEEGMRSVEAHYAIIALQKALGISGWRPF